MKRLILAATVAAIIPIAAEAAGLPAKPGPAFGSWQSWSVVDPMTDKTRNLVTVKASDGSASLRVECYPVDLSVRLKELTMRAAFPFGDDYMQVRIDHDTAVLRHVHCEAHICWLDNESEAKAVTSRMEAGSRVLVGYDSYDGYHVTEFDITGAKDAFAYLHSVCPAGDKH
jgi:hypothetical protein